MFDRLRLYLAAFLASLFAAGLILQMARPEQGQPVTLMPPPTETPIPTPGPIEVHVTGEVHNPGLYELPAGSNVADALEAAGDVTANGELGEMNIAKLLTDGDQVYVPAIGEPTPAPDSVQDTIFPININTATTEELDELPGIGPALAERIVEYREENGPFAVIEDIMNVPGIGEGKFAEIKDLITVS